MQRLVELINENFNWRENYGKRSKNEGVTVSLKFWDQFYQHFMSSFLWTKIILLSFSLITVWLCNFLAKEYWRKSCSKNVDEIDTRAQFHQDFPISICTSRFTVRSSSWCTVQRRAVFLNRSAVEFS